MIQSHPTFDSFPATIALEKELDSVKYHRRSIFAYRSSRTHQSKQALTRSLGENQEEFPLIKWYDSDDDNEFDCEGRFCECQELEHISSEPILNHGRSTNHGLVRSRSVNSKLHMLGEEKPPKPLAATSFFFVNDVNLESLVRISVPYAHLTVSG